MSESLNSLSKIKYKTIPITQINNLTQCYEAVVAQPGRFDHTEKI